MKSQDIPHSVASLCVFVDPLRLQCSAVGENSSAENTMFTTAFACHYRCSSSRGWTSSLTLSQIWLLKHRIKHWSVRPSKLVDVTLNTCDFIHIIFLSTYQYYVIFQGTFSGGFEFLLVTCHIDKYLVGLKSHFYFSTVNIH